MKLLFPNGEHDEVRLANGVTRFGNRTDSDVLLIGPGIAYEHCTVELYDDEATLVVLAPENVVLLNGRPVEGRATIKPGDLILFGKIGARVAAAEPAPRAIQMPGQGASAPAPAENRTRARPSLPRFALRGVSGTTFGKIYPLVGTMTIGRAPECDIPIPDGEISRQHARLREQADGVGVEDLGSSNGTFLNGTRIDVAVARGGDELRFDTLRFVVQAPEQVSQQRDAPAAPAAAAAQPAVAAPSKPSGVPSWMWVAVGFVVVGAILYFTMF